MRFLGLTTVLLLCAGCRDFLPVSADATDIGKSDPCSQAWAEMKPEQQTAEGSRETFEASCGASSWVARCVDGYVDRAQANGQLCINHRGIAHAVERK